MTVTRLADFKGDWTLTRMIDDARADETGHLIGTASFKLDGSLWRYHEIGTLSLPDGPPMTAMRDYLFVETKDGATVQFSNRRAFHHIQWDRPEATHDCPPDSYRVRYDFAAFPHWTAIWQVAGPRKAYTMTSTYSRP